MREADFDSAVALVERMHPDLRGAFEPLRVVRDLIRAAPPARERVLNELVQRRTLLPLTVAHLMIDARSDYALADRLFEQAAPETAFGKAFRSLLTGHSLAARGRWREAWPHYLQAADHDPNLAWGGLAWCAQLPTLDIPRADLARILAMVEQSDSTVTAPEDPYAWDHLVPHLRFYYLGIVHARLGNLSEARRYIERLASAPTPAPRRRVVHALQVSLEVRLLMAQGRWADALRRHESIQLTMPLDMIELGPDRYIRAELLLSAGRAGEALRWLEDMDAFLGAGSGPSFIYDGPRALRRAQAYEAMGRRDEAARWYGRFLELWENADEGNRPLLQAARERSAALLSQPR